MKEMKKWWFGQQHELGLARGETRTSGKKIYLPCHICNSFLITQYKKD